MGKNQRLEPSLVEEFVGKAHGDFQRVKQLLNQEPALINATWDWGEGDWETALGAAAHTGSRDIAEYLLDRGARLDIFAATMLGYTEIVRAFVAQRPDSLSLLGPHGIPLIAHAEVGGAEAAEVLVFLKNQMKD
ncbi:MAG: ankyrin repeat domain-containing protein [Candidatus Poribacteria bacterium]|nr:ankyrin repeat domain-containing protein [Candidatus Poribacteria bacterium]MDD9975834.1 ankyrin repeat domain-containing protein [Candidatus Poribacteria bacterium]MDE0326896.1 ankyrin repeat domain-containing protein [Candidatus Poribacteria bacterium]